MDTIEIIEKKKDGKVLSPSEIEHMVTGYTDGTIPDYQMAAFLMAVCIRGMNREETITLTRVMKNSGDVVDLSAIKGIKTDKHSTGGVGDKTTLIVGPVAAACGVPVAKMSGRGLGFTGGTIDKLESIPGYQTAISEEKFTELVNTNGISLIGQTGHIAPADKKIYALRDVTGTVGNISLITSSIMSKKLAAGSDAILLDVKCGSGAFMKTIEEAEELSELMVEIGNADGKDTRAVITDMSQPLGKAVGNALEVKEAIDVLKGKGPEDITELSIILAGMMADMSNVAEDTDAGIEMAKRAIADGSALEKFRTLVAGQGGNPEITENSELLPTAPLCIEIKAERDGYITAVDALTVGLASQHTGAGRQTKEDSIDLAAGIILEKKTGDEVRKGDVLMRLYGSDEARLKKAQDEVSGAVVIDKNRPEKSVLIKKIVTGGN